jgi:toxin ParE1/3/4
MKYAFHPDAAVEYLESITFYEHRLKGLGADFIAAFERVASNICLSPLLHPLEVKPDIRIARMKRFPYNILFREKEAAIQILAVAHQRRHHRYWLSRNTQ